MTTARTDLERRAAGIHTRHRMRSNLETIESLRLQDAQSTASNVWNNLTLLNSWVNFNAATHATAQYMKDNEGVVHVRGVIKDGTAVAGTVLFTLPAGFRPPLQLIMVCNGNGVFEYVDVKANGDVALGEASSAVYFAFNFSFGT